MPQKFPNDEALDFFLSEPYPETVEMMKRLPGDIMILGVGGKMGPTLALQAKRAIDTAGVSKKVIGVARFSDPQQKHKLDSHGIETISCDLMDLDKVEALPKMDNLIFMAGRKFGSPGSEALTWMMNAIAPYHVARSFKGKNIVAFSTGCVYSLVSPNSGGSRETDNPLPLGEYANSCLGRERIFDYFSENYGTRTLHYRLNYSVELRYGVLVDIAIKVFHNQPVDLGVSYVNGIWQGDACNRALLCLEHTSSPANIMNITGPELLSIKELALQFGSIFQKEVTFTGQDTETYYLSNSDKSNKLFGNPRISPDEMVKWIAEWIQTGGSILGKPTHFEVTDGQFLDGK